MKVVVISGAATGLGLGVAKRFLALGYKVYAGYNKTRPPQISPAPEFIKLDVTSDISCQKALKAILAKEKRVDLVVNCAGISPAGTTTDFTASQFDRVFQVNCVGPFRLIKAALPGLQKKGGIIINVTSLNSFLALPHSGIYCASKFGLDALGFSLRQELVGQNIKVVNVAPGAFLKEVEKAPQPMAHVPVREKFPILRWLFPFTPQSKVVDTIVNIVQEQRFPPRIIVGVDAKIAYLLVKLLPVSWLDKLLTLIWQKRGSLAFRS